MNTLSKFVLGFALVLFIAMITTIVVKIIRRKGKEPFAQNPSSGNKFLTSDINGNLSLYTTNNDSIIVTDSRGVMKNLPFPKGLIMIWHNNGTTNPTNDDLAPGWSLCDGGIYNNYTTPDLRGRFVLGAGSGTNLTARTVGVVGGTETHTLTIPEMPSHNHNMSQNICNGTNCPRHNAFGGSFNNSVFGYNWSVDNTGGNQPHNNMPPFYVLCYICYTGDRL